MVLGGLALLLATQQYLALFILVGIEEAGVPLPMPADLLIMYLGYRVTVGEANPILVIATVVLAATVGSLALYALSRRLGRPTVLRFGRFIHLDERRLSQVEGWFAKRGTPAIVFGRLIPGLRTASSIVSGVFRIPYRQFSISIAASSFLWAIIYLTIGMLFGAAYAQLSTYLAAHIEVLIVFALAVVATGAGIYYLRRKQQLRKATLK
jgi:membrane protein DedA with SNARE-associated domain